MFSKIWIWQAFRENAKRSYVLYEWITVPKLTDIHHKPYIISFGHLLHLYEAPTTLVKPMNPYYKYSDRTTDSDLMQSYQMERTKIRNKSWRADENQVNKTEDNLILFKEERLNPVRLGILFLFLVMVNPLFCYNHYSFSNQQIEKSKTSFWNTKWYTPNAPTNRTK